MAKKLIGWQAGMLVYMRSMYGEKAGLVDERSLWKIKQIGPKQVTLSRVDQKTGVEMGYSGHRIRLYDKEVAEQHTNAYGQGSYRRLYPWEWSQLLVPISEAGWDPDINF